MLLNSVSTVRTNRQHGNYPKLDFGGLAHCIVICMEISEIRLDQWGIRRLPFDIWDRLLVSMENWTVCVRARLTLKLEEKRELENENENENENESEIQSTVTYGMG